MGKYLYVLKDWPWPRPAWLKAFRAMSPTALREPAVMEIERRYLLLDTHHSIDVNALLNGMREAIECCMEDSGVPPSAYQATRAISLEAAELLVDTRDEVSCEIEIDTEKAFGRSGP